MDKLEQIFASNKYLLDEPEVKELIEYTKLMYEKIYKAYKKKDDLNFKILELCMHSNVILKKGIDNTKVVESILELINNED